MLLPSLSVSLFICVDIEVNFFRMMMMTMNLKMDEINGKRERKGKLGVRTKKGEKRKRRKRQIVEM